MNETITSIQDTVYDNNDLSKEEKVELIGRLEMLKSMNFGDYQKEMEASLVKLLEAARENISQVKEFFQGMDKSMATFLEKGASQAIDDLYKEVAAGSEDN